MKTVKHINQVIEMGLLPKRVVDALKYIAERYHESTTLKEVSVHFSSEVAFYWALLIGDEEMMKDRIRDSRWAYLWAYHIGDTEEMRKRVTEEKWIRLWKRKIG